MTGDRSAEASWAQQLVKSIGVQLAVRGRYGLRQITGISGLLGTLIQRKNKSSSTLYLLRISLKLIPCAELVKV